MSNRNLTGRWINPAVVNKEIWPGPDGYPATYSENATWIREALLRRTGKNKLITTWTTGGFAEPADGNFTMISTSSDSGICWKNAGRFQHPVKGLFTTELFSPCEGEIHAFLQTYSFGEWMTGLRSYRSISTDHGTTWSTPNSIPGGIDNAWVNRGIILTSGRWLLPVSWAEHCGSEWGPPSNGQNFRACIIGKQKGKQLEMPFGVDSMSMYTEGICWANRNHSYCCGVIISDDGGKSFRRCGYLKSRDSGHLIEPRIVEAESGHIIMLARSMDEANLWRSDSYDYGETWSEIKPTNIPNPSAKVNILKSSDGSIFLLHNPTGGKYVNGNWVMNPRTPLSLWISHDNMISWQTKIDLVRDDTPGVALNYPDGYLDEELGIIDFVWEDTYSVFRMQVPMDIK